MVILNNSPKLEGLARILSNEIASAVPSLSSGRLAMTVTMPLCHCGELKPRVQRGGSEAISWPLCHCERSEAISNRSRKHEGSETLKMLSDSLAALQPSGRQLQRRKEGYRSSPIMFVPFRAFDFSCFRGYLLKLSTDLTI